MEKSMRKRMLFILSTLSFLMCPLSLWAQNSFSLSLDVNSAAGDQAVTSLNTSADQVVAIQIFGTDIQNANALAVRFEYHASQVTYEGFDVGSVLPNAQALPEHGTNPTFVEIGIASLGGQATANSGLMGTIRFRATAAFSGTAIQLVRAELSRGGRFETITPNIRVALPTVSTGPSPDFDGNGIVDIADFLAFVSQFGSSRGDGTYQAKYDLDSDGQIAISDFLSFVNDFGKEVPTTGGGSGGGGGSGSPDLIVELPSVRDSTLTAGQSFTLRATVRNQGSGQAAATTLRYYQSSDATITVNDTQVGTDAIVSLNTSGTSAESINLNAPSRAGTYYYGACVEQVSGEPEIDNNCSDAVRVSVSGGTGLVDIPDRNLRAAIEMELRKAGGAPITAADMATFVGLDAEYRGISDLTGLEFATNLEVLWLSGNNISDISPLSGLTNLRSLVLWGNSISDISALSGLTKLKQLLLLENSISDISALSGLTNLTELLLSHNPISDISALSGLTKLEKLWLSSTSISDWSPLSGLTNLTELSLGSNISDISALSGLTKLEVLWLNSNSISDISALSGLTKLEVLWLNNNSISDIFALSGLTNLTRLELSYNSISDISPLANLIRLEILDLGRNSISDISALSGLTNLTSLDLGSNSIADISVLSGLTKLEWLDLHSNSISDISALSGLTNLRSLWLYNNSISDISPLANLIRLKNLRLDSNSISDLAPLVANTGLGYGDEINVQNNPLSATSLNTHIPTLQGRGVTVQFGSSKPVVAEKEARMPRAEMKGFEDEKWEKDGYIYRKWMAEGEDEISPAAKVRPESIRTSKIDARVRMRMEMKQEMISRKARLRDKAKREGK